MFEINNTDVITKKWNSINVKIRWYLLEYKQY